MPIFKCLECVVESCLSVAYVLQVGVITDKGCNLGHFHKICKKKPKKFIFILLV